MSLNKFPTPQLHTLDSDALPLSNLALLQLMQAVLAKGFPFRFKALGCSMFPFINDGDVIVVSPFKGDNPKIGEVLAFIHPVTGMLTVHRVIAKKNCALLMQGDSVSEHSDGLVLMENILGRVTNVERKGNSIWLGLGIERNIIAWLSRTRILIPIFEHISSFENFLSRKGS